MAWIRTDKEDGSQEEVSELRIFEILTGYYDNVNLALLTAKLYGISVESSFATYRWVTEVTDGH